MKKNKIYLLLLSLTTVLLFSLSAICNQCTSVVLGVKETAETAEKTEEKEETIEKQEETEYAGWKTYVNDVYGYEFNYPDGTEISEAQKSSFGIPTEDQNKDITVDDIYDKYTGKICITVAYKLGYIVIAVPENIYVECGRTGVGSEYEIKEIEEKLIIDGKEYTAEGLELTGENETLNNHGEFLRVNLEDGIRIEYGSKYDETATYEEYLKIKEIIVKIVESYKRTEEK